MTSRSVEVVGRSDMWAKCKHPHAGPTDHACPTCHGTLRRCCDSLVGWYPHRSDCPEVGRRATEDVA